MLLDKVVYVIDYDMFLFNNYFVEGLSKTIGVFVKIKSYICLDTTVYLIDDVIQTNILLC